jgi:type VI secretion system protein ImpC
MSIGINFGSEERPSVRAQTTSESKTSAFRVAIVGNFSGRKPQAQEKPFADRKPIPIDRDNLETVMQKLEVQIENLTLSPDGEPFSLQFREIDDFHPDSLYRNLKLFETFRTLRKQLNDPRTFDSAAATVRSWISPESPKSEPTAPPAPEPSASEPPPSEEDIDPGNLLDQILDQDSDSQPAESGRSQWQEVIHEIVAPHAIPGKDPELPELLECLDSVIARTMTHLLKNAEFRNLERNWTLLQKVVRNVETGRQFKIYLVDVSREELAESLQKSGPVNQSELFQVLDIEKSGTARWDLIVSTETFSRTADSADLLSRLGVVCLSPQGSLLAAADGSHVGCDDLDRQPDADEWEVDDEPEANEIWSRLKSSALAGGIGLLWPNVLVRLPYGSQTNPIDSFRYEELDGQPKADDLLWGSPALLAIVLYARAVTIPSDELQPEDVQQIDRMPLLIYKADGETESYPCGECFLNEPAIEKVLAAGLSPVVSVRDQDTIRFPRILSLNGTSLLW